ncbi:CRP-like cAMP-binding protein [Natronocella acetinitrilica]|uniref:CRP-like cAMP-binding protein n=1 Tax=Natronocella acetinitrilica TaxID=414046 RepID=A0AAE3G4N6_9GAMM|nr:Crp/Fnr family transcriptional regulator [Natronocella acetinitrilica]MCP1675775.1 CRP-like cAMP-binding protein [Natronocella acetinitrilica]
MKFPRGAVLFEAGVPQRNVYFPEDTIVSSLYVMEDGASAEVALVGNDGLVGINLVMRVDASPSRAVVLTPGKAYRLPIKAFHREMDASPELLALMLRYVQIRFVQTAQLAACYRHHSLRQQFCWLLLLANDCLPDNRIALTHELIASVLGVRREGVTEAAHRLQSEGVIHYTRGLIRVLDRQRLERLACECYGVVKRETDRLLHPPENRSRLHLRR